MSLLQLLLLTATAGSGAALAPNTRRRCVAGHTRSVARNVLDDEAIGLDLEALGDLGALDAAAV